jgi:hypothetical protein
MGTDSLSEDIMITLTLTDAQANEIVRLSLLQLLESGVTDYLELDDIMGLEQTLKFYSTGKQWEDYMKLVDTEEDDDEEVHKV